MASERTRLPPRRLNLKKNSFDEQMQADADKMTNMMGIGSAIMFGGILVLLLPQIL